jgi:hypothetical protein
MLGARGNRQSQHSPNKYGTASLVRPTHIGQGPSWHYAYIVSIGCRGLYGAAIYSRPIIFSGGVSNRTQPGASTLNGWKMALSLDMELWRGVLNNKSYSQARGHFQFVSLYRTYCLFHADPRLPLPWPMAGAPCTFHGSTHTMQLLEHRKIQAALNGYDLTARSKLLYRLQHYSADLLKACWRYGHPAQV